MRGRLLLLAAVTAPTLAGCGGFGSSASAPPTTTPAETGSIALPPASAPPAPPQPPAPETPTGAALGAVLGGPVGAALTEADRQAAWQAQIAALDSGQRRSWRGAHGVFGFVEPGAETGAGCRAYAQTIYVAGRANRGQGVACRKPDGGWKMSS
jgi:surface antigen